MIDVNYAEYKETIAENMELIIKNHKLKEENKRLSKIIYEYEKWLIERVSDGSNMEENHIYIISFNKLKELKGSNNNE